MTDDRPLRLQLSRRKGFDLQAVSHGCNGLMAVNVARPSKWGNPFNFSNPDWCWAALSFGCRADKLGRQRASVEAFRRWIDNGPDRVCVALELQPKIGRDETWVDLGPLIKAGRAPTRADIVASLAGKNLACWCKTGDPCHADVLLELANRLPVLETASLQLEAPL